MNHHFEQYKVETLQAMEESFSKLNNYEEVMDLLKRKNDEL